MPPVHYTTIGLIPFGARWHSLSKGLNLKIHFFVIAWFLYGSVVIVWFRKEKRNAK